MFDDIKSELSKLIAAEIYSQARQIGKSAGAAIKKTDLRAGGSGLPESVLAEFERSFHDAFRYIPNTQDGYAKWRKDGSETTFDFLLRAPLVDSIAGSNWAKAARLTGDGTAQIAALGGAGAYNKAVAASIGSAFDFAVAKLVGQFVVGSGAYGWRFLTRVLSVKVAREGTSDFQPVQLFYWSRGKDAETKTAYKLAKSSMTSGVWRKPVPPSAGPYYSP